MNLTWCLNGIAAMCLTVNQTCLAIEKNHGFDEPAVLSTWSDSQLHALRELCQGSGRECWLELKTQADEALHTAPRPITQIIYEGHLPTHPDRVRTVSHLDDISKLRALGYAWLVTEDQRYAKQAVSYIQAWANVYQPTGNPINENKLASLISVYGMLRDTFFDEPIRQSIDRWLINMADANQQRAESQTQFNNWQSKRIKIVALVGTALHDQKRITWVRDRFIQYINHGLRSDGSSEDFHKRDALTYHSGGLKPLLDIARTLPGVNLYHLADQNGASLQRSVAFLASYVDGTRTHAEWVNTKVELDRKRAAGGLAEYQPGRIYQPIEALGVLEQAVQFEAKYKPLIQTIRKQNHLLDYSWELIIATARS